MLLWSGLVAVESDCCCGVGLLLWSLIVAVESDCCCGVGLLLWSQIVAVEWACCCGVGLLLWSLIVAVESDCGMGLLWIDCWTGEGWGRRCLGCCSCLLLLPPASFLSGSGGPWHSLIDRKFVFIDRKFGSVPLASHNLFSSFWCTYIFVWCFAGARRSILRVPAAHSE